MIKNLLATKLVEAMTRREQSLFENKALLAFMLLDARYLCFLSKEQCNTAKQCLKNHWNIIDIQETNIEDSSHSDNSQEPQSSNALSTEN